MSQASYLRYLVICKKIHKIKHMEEKELDEYRLKGEFLMDLGLAIILEMKLTKSTSQSRFPMKDKFSWIACNKDNPQEEFILFDNHHKSPHFHIDDREKFTFFT